MRTLMFRNKMLLKIIKYHTLIVAIGLVIISSGFSSTYIIKAATQANLTVLDAKAMPGTNVNVLVSIKDIARLGATTLVLTYDSTKLKVVSSKSGAALTSGMSQINDSIAGKITQVYINATGFTGTGEFMNITFEILVDTKQDIPLTLKVNEFIDFETYKTIPITINQGKISVVDSISEINSPNSQISSISDVSGGIDLKTSTISKAESISNDNNDKNLYATIILSVIVVLIFILGYIGFIRKRGQ